MKSIQRTHLQRVPLHLHRMQSLAPCLGHREHLFQTNNRSWAFFG